MLTIQHTRSYWALTQKHQSSGSSKAASILPRKNRWLCCSCPTTDPPALGWVPQRVSALLCRWPPHTIRTGTQAPASPGCGPCCCTHGCCEQRVQQRSQGLGRSTASAGSTVVETSPVGHSASRPAQVGSPDDSLPAVLPAACVPPAAAVSPGLQAHED
jgi:hypothetical protein